MAILMEPFWSLQKDLTYILVGEKKCETKQTLHLPQACFLFLHCCRPKILALDKSSGLFGAELCLSFLWKRLKTLAQLHHKSLKNKCQDRLPNPHLMLSPLCTFSAVLYGRGEAVFFQFPFSRLSDRNNADKFSHILLKNFYFYNQSHLLNNKVPI